MSNIIGTCAKCGFEMDIVVLGPWLKCPNCRLQAVQKAFSPIEPLRTALGIEGLREDSELPGVYHWGESSYVEDGSPFREPEVCMPKYEDDQIYELRRLFRL